MSDEYWKERLRDVSRGKNNVKVKITGKFVYGGMLTDKYYLTYRDIPFQVSRRDYDRYEVGDDYELDEDTK